MTDDGCWPTEIRLLADRHVLRVAFGERSFDLPAELLRVESPSAEVQGHGPSEKRLVSGKRGVRIVTVEPVGNYAVRMLFDDGHSTGIYGWPYLHDLGTRQAAIMDAYAGKLAAAGLSRDR